MPTAKHDPQQPVYLRVGTWNPDNPRSTNYALGEVEAGLSVYELTPAGEPITPAESEWAEIDKHERLASGEPKFVVQGVLVGEGHDGEPLLQEVVVVGKWRGRDFNPDPRWTKGEGGKFTGSEAGQGGESGTYGFVSPNVKNLSIEQAAGKLGASSKRTRALAQVAHDINQRLGLRARNSSVIGAWADGAENSMLFQMAGDDPELERVALAMQGYIADQKAVLHFRPHADGKEWMARFSMRGDSPAIHRDLSTRGIAFHTLRPTSEGTVVYVYGDNQDLLEKVGAAARAHSAKFAVALGTGEFIGTKLDTGSDRQQRDDARRAYAEVIHASRRRGVGHIWEELRDRWAARLSQLQDQVQQALDDVSGPFEEKSGSWLKDPETGELIGSTSREGGGGGGESAAPARGVRAAAAPAAAAAPGARTAPRARGHLPVKENAPAGPSVPAAAEQTAPKEKLTGTNEAAHPAKISPSHTETELKIANSEAEYVPANVEQMTRSNTAGRSPFVANAKLFQNPLSYPMLQPAEVVDLLRREGETEADHAVRNAHHLVRTFIDRAKENMRFLLDRATSAQRGAIHWYRGANSMVHAAARAYGKHHAAIAGVFAALSPNKDWDENVYIAQSLLDIFHNQQETAWSDHMNQTALLIFNKPDHVDKVNFIRGTTIKELLTPSARQTADWEKAKVSREELIGMWVRVYEETYGDPNQPLVKGEVKIKDKKAPWLNGIQHERGFKAFKPDGTMGEWRLNQDGVTKGKVTQQSIAAMGDAVEALLSEGDRSIISTAMGTRHKVRSFYNNIVDPEGTDGDVTIDTHAISAVFLHWKPPAAVAHGLASNPGRADQPEGWETSASNDGVGSYGTYGIIADAYRELAAEEGLLPNELQALIWIIKKEAFDDMADVAKTGIDEAWRRFNVGEQTLEQTQDTLWDIVEVDQARKADKATASRAAYQRKLERAKAKAAKEKQ